MNLHSFKNIGTTTHYYSFGAATKYFVIYFQIKYKTRSSWLNCALRDNEAVFWVSIGHYEAVADVNWQGWTGKLFFSRGGARPKIYGAGRSGEPPPPSFSAGCCNIVPSLVSSIGESLDWGLYFAPQLPRHFDHFYGAGNPAFPIVQGGAGRPSLMGSPKMPL